MPGIVGIFSRGDVSLTNDRIDLMLAAMSIEPYYKSSKFIFPEKGVYLGSITLAETKSSATCRLSPDGNTTLLLAGEVLSIDDRSVSPDNVGLIATEYERCGIASLSKLNGWFSGALFDNRTGETLLFNDRYGMQRIYYYQSDDCFAFASEAKCLLSAFPSLRSIDPVAMGEYMTSDCVYQDRTLFSHVSLLPPASAWRLSNTGICKDAYFEPSRWEAARPLKDNDVAGELDEAFTRVLPDHFRDGPVGFALTGGIDTRMILAGILERSAAMKCFTFTGPYRDSFDTRIARLLCMHTRLPHTTLRIGNDYFRDYSSHVARTIYATDGVADVTTCDESYLNRLSRGLSHIKVTGKFGSQVLRGVSGLRLRRPGTDIIHPGFIPHMEHALETFSSFSTQHPLSRFLFKDIPWYWSRYTVPELQHVIVRSPYLDNRFVEMLYRVGPGFKASRFQAEYVGRHSPLLYNVMTDKGLCGKPSLSRLLRRLYYKSFTLADKVYGRDELPFGLTHPVSRLDSFLHPLHMDALIRGRALCRHYRVWFREQLSDYVTGLVLHPRTLERPYWKPDTIRQMVNAHTQGRRNHLPELRKVMTIELVHRVLVEDFDPRSFQCEITSNKSEHR
jgi:asparagine synthase (glutamine-hydrolysing)